MTAIFEMPMESETLTAEELTRITGSPRSKGQIDWLDLEKFVDRKIKEAAHGIGKNT